MIQHSAPQHVTETSTSSASQPKGNHSIRDTNGCQKLTTIKRYLKQRLFHRNSKCFLLKCFIYLRSGEGMRGRSRRGEFSQMLDHCRALATVEKGPGQRQDPQVSTQVSHTTAGVQGQQESKGVSHPPDFPRTSLTGTGCTNHTEALERETRTSQTLG